MIDHFIEAWRETLGKEGGYSNHRDDPGGATTFGITEAVARHHGYKGGGLHSPVALGGLAPF